MNLCLTRPFARHALVALVAVASLGIEPAAAQSSGAKPLTPDVARGRYLVMISGCNDCHTHDYPETAGKVDEKLWLTGSPLGWRGPWGTTYAANLRLVVPALTEAQWLVHARSERRPPMPWFNLRDMSDADLRAIHRYLKRLGSAGTPAPAYVPPDKPPNPPFVQFPMPPK